MSIENKIKRYKKYYIGLAYLKGAYELNTYIVLKKEKIEFVLLECYDFNRKEEIDKMVIKLEKEGYKSKDLYIEENIKKLLKENSNGR